MIEVKLRRPGLKLDPRANYPFNARFDIHYHADGITVTLTRVDNCDDWIEDELSLRSYDPRIETVPDFTSTIYVYMGLDNEHAPFDTTLIIIHPSVKIIKYGAFYRCRELRRVIMHENVETIEKWAFFCCESLDAVFLPSSIKTIGDGAFEECTNLRILSIPQTIDVGKIGERIIEKCDTFFRITQIPPYMYERNNNASTIIINNNDQVHQAIIDFNHTNLPPLHKVCLSTNVTAQSIRQCIDAHGIAAAYNTEYGDGTMTPMHILALNPHADTGAILTLFHANMIAIFQPYREGYGDDDDDDFMEDDFNVGGETPFDLMCIDENVSSSNNSIADTDTDMDHTYLVVVAALCKHREETH